MLSESSLLRMIIKESNKETYAEQFVISFIRGQIDKPVFVGTGFLFSPCGLFITAKHVLYEHEKYDEDLFAITLNKEGIPIQSKIVWGWKHNTADIAFGIIQSPDYPPNEFGELYDIITPQLNFDETIINGNIFAYSFRNSIFNSVDSMNYEMQYIPTLYTGIVQGFHPEGIRLIKNPSYDCLMNSQPGCSGGPVFYQNSKIIGIISACLPGDETVMGNMTATDIRLALSLIFPSPFKQNRGELISCYTLRDMGILR